jgi:type I restriction enzyme S subunit
MAAMHANGANVLHLSPSAIADFSVPVPPHALQQSFAQNLSPLFEMADTLTATEPRLAASRDLLLPRLISGELSVESAERQLEAAA